MRKGPDCVDDKGNISVVIGDKDTRKLLIKL
jgi:hypothetical protein